MRKSISQISIVILLLLILFPYSAFATQGALPGAFSVSASAKVQFSQGNLQYQASTNTWRFALHQYDIIGAANKNVSSTYSGWIDLFGWSSDSRYVSFGVSSNTYGSNYAGNFIDWGVNPISNGGNQANKWRTLTSAQWDYIFSGRSNASSLRFRATVNGRTGFVLLPDGFTKGTFKYTTNVNNYTTNTYTVSQWQEFENMGAVFLPCAGTRFGTVVSYVNERANYRSKSTYDSTRGYSFWFANDAYQSQHVDNFADGSCVRLVQTASASYTITFNANGGTTPTSRKLVAKGSTYGTLPIPTRTGYTFDGWYTAANGGTKIESTTTVSITADQTLYAHWTPVNCTITTIATNGIVSGEGTYAYDSNATLTATPADCYTFARWSDGNTDNPRTVMVTGDATYTAIFEKMQYTVTTAPDDAAHGETEAAEIE